MSLDSLSTQAADFLRNHARERCEVALSRLREPKLGALYATYRDLFSLAAISEVQRFVAGAAGEEERRGRYLLEFLVEGRARCEAADEIDNRLTYESFGSVQAGESRLTVAQLAAVLADTENAAERHRIQEARLEVLAGEEPICGGLLAQQRSAVEEVGYNSYLDAAEIVSGIDLRGVASEAAELIAATDGAYADLLHYHLPRLTGADPADATEAEIYRIAAAAPYAGSFREREPIARFAAVFASGALEPTAHGRIDVRLRSELPAGPGAVCCPLSVPEEIVVHAVRAGGRNAHESCLSALAYALAHAWTDPDLPVEFRLLGDEAVPQAWALLYSGLLTERGFLRTVYGIGSAEAAELARLGALLVLLRARRTAALLNASVDWSTSGDLDAARGHTAELLTSATSLRHDERISLWLLDLPTEFARRLRAEQLASVLALHLRDRFDEDWYRNPRAGPHVIELMEPGRRFTADEVAVQLSSAALDSGSFSARLQELLAS